MTTAQGLEKTPEQWQAIGHSDVTQTVSATAVAAGRNPPTSLRSGASTDAMHSALFVSMCAVCWAQPRALWGRDDEVAARAPCCPGAPRIKQAEVYYLRGRGVSTLDAHPNSPTEL